MSLPVSFSPLALQPDAGRIDLTLPQGMTVAEIVAVVLPGAPDSVLDRVRVVLVQRNGMAAIPRSAWRAKPKAGVQIVITITPGKQAFQIIVAIAALAASTFFGPLLGPLLGVSDAFAKGLIGLGVTALGGLLINALFPQKKDPVERPTYAIAGWQNEYRPDAPVPMPFGTVRYAPPFAASSYIEVVGDLLYVRAVFLWGYGPLDISSLRIGETSIDKYEEITVETRQGYDDDEPLTLYTNQVIEEKVGTELMREFTRDDTGKPLENGWSAPTDAKPISRFTAQNSTHAIAIISFPSGLGFVGANNSKKSMNVYFGLRMRKAGVEEWTVLESVNIVAKKFAGFYREIRFDFPERGRYEIEIDRLTPSEAPESEDHSYVFASTWVVLQSFRPEYPFNFSKPLALTAVRVKSTHQLNGTLDTFNGLVRRIALDWDADTETWVEQITNNPAAAARFALQGPGLFKPRTDEQINLSAMQEWHEFCASKGLEYNRVHDADESFGDAIAVIGAAGRAAIRHDGRQFTAIIDRPRETPIDHVNPRNSSGFRASPSYFEPPDALRITFADETNEYQEAERIVPWPGHVGPVDITEELKLPGVTNPDKIWIEARRRQYEIMYRSVAYTATQQGTARTATSGDLVMASQDVLRRSMASARVKSIHGNIIEIDDVWTMEEGESYSVRFRRFDEDDTIGESVVRPIQTVAGEVSSVRLVGDGYKPEVGDILHFGPSGSDSIPLIIVGIERGKNNSSILHMLASAEIIDELTDAEVPPEWDSKVGSEAGENLTQPLAPRFISVVSGTVETGVANRIAIILAPGLEETTPLAYYQVEHRLSGDLAWSGPETCTVGSASVTIDDYLYGDTVEIRAWAVSVAGVDGAFGPAVTEVVGTSDTPPVIIYDFAKAKSLPIII